eukprot:Nk52_evm47s217 gene=Nk52_evmTU47s217
MWQRGNLFLSKPLGGWLSRGIHRTKDLSPKFKLSSEVAAAQVEGRAVVALESTIISHGMPYPQNLETAMEVEDIIRENGATPATIAVLDGVPHIGLEREELELLAKCGLEAKKTSRRDFPNVLSQKLVGATTVSGTMFLAHKASIPVFVTGGIGGVHRGAETTFDVSADLTELGRTPVAVVCAGVKSILDIGKTLEYLETQGVPVVTFGKSKKFPAFFVPESQYDSAYTTASTKECAEMIQASLAFNIGTGLVIAVPIPEEKSSDGQMIENAISESLREANDKNIVGKDVTPFILQRVNELTKGKSLVSNIALVKNNALVGSKIACDLQRLSGRTFNRNIVNNHIGSRFYHTAGVFGNANKGLQCGPDFLNRDGVIVLGGCLVDIQSKVNPGASVISDTSNPGTTIVTPGGVGRNIAECLAKFGVKTSLFSMIGNDIFGDFILQQANEIGIQTKGVFRVLKDDKQSRNLYESDTDYEKALKSRTATYSAFLDSKGSLVVGISDIEIFSNFPPIPRIANCFGEPKLAVFDGNLSCKSMTELTELASEKSIPVWFEPTSCQKAKLPIENNSFRLIDFISPNLEELYSMLEAFKKRSLMSHSRNLPPLKLENPMPSSISGQLSDICQVAQHFPFTVITLGPEGVLITYRGKNMSSKNRNTTPLHMLHYSPILDFLGEPNIVSVTGAGDSMVAGIITALSKGYSFPNSVYFGILASHKALESTQAISSEIRPDDIPLYADVRSGFVQTKMNLFSPNSPFSHIGMLDSYPAGSETVMNN